MDEERTPNNVINTVKEGVPFDQFVKPTVVYDGNPSQWFYANKGLTINTHEIGIDYSFLDEAGAKQSIKQGTIIAEWDYKPIRAEYVAGTRTYATSQLIECLEGFVNIPQSMPSLDQPVYFINKTNPQMANVLKRFGFQIVSPEDNIGYPQKKIRSDQVQTVGVVEDVKKALLKFKEKKIGFLEKMAKRNDLEVSRKTSGGMR